MDEIKNGQHLEELIKKQIDKNLSMSILKQGEWGSYRNLSSEVYQKFGVENVTNTSFLSTMRYNKNFQHICWVMKLMITLTIEEYIVS